MSFNDTPSFDTFLCSDFCTRVADGTHDSPKETPKGKRLVTSKNVKGGRLQVDTAYFISEEDFEEINRRSKVDQWDLLLTMIGTVGEVCLVNAPEPDFAIKNVGLLKCGSELNAKWLYYFLRSPQGQKLIEQRKKGSTQQYISLTEIRNLPISVPRDHSHLKGTVALLASIDERITLLRETNITLEAIAQALFKSWFVDFDPVRAKMAGRAPEGMDEATAALFPDSFEDSELGEVPRGWKLVPFGSLLTHTIGGDWGSEVPDETNDTRVAIIRGTDIPDLQSASASRVPIRFTSQKKLKSRQLADGDIVLEVSGGSKDQPTGRSIYVTSAMLETFDCPVEPASFCRLLRPASKEISLQLSQHLTFIYAQGKTWEYQNQSTGIANFQTTHFLENELVATPSEEVLAVFAEIVRSIVDRIHAAPISVLSQLRDNLLPRLISGQLRLPEAQALINESA